MGYVLFYKKLFLCSAASFFLISPALFFNKAKAQTITLSSNDVDYSARAEYMAIERDHNLYAKAFSYAKRGDELNTTKLLTQTSDKNLSPYVEAELIINEKTPKEESLKKWLNNYSNLGIAPLVYEKGIKLGFLNLEETKISKKEQLIINYKSPKEFAHENAPNATSIDIGNIDKVATLFRNNNDYDAIAFANSQINSGTAGKIAWFGGLSAYRIGDFEKALAFFDKTANWQYADDYTKSEGAYWAARTALKLKDEDKAKQYFELAAKQPFTFYGQLALMRLGIWQNFTTPNIHSKNNSFNNLIESNRLVRNSLELYDSGQKEIALIELKNAWLRSNHEYDYVFIIIANSLGLKDFEKEVRQGSGFTDIMEAYPIPDNIAPQGGDFILDKALLFAVMRQESRFKTNAISYAGARGLMQLMPTTAAWIAKNSAFKENPDLLHDNSINISLGEGYLEYVMRLNIIDGSVAKALMAYNAGPGNVSKWKAKIEMSDDTLMFIEATPNTQARQYVKKVMTNLWIYHKRLNQAAPTLHKLAFDKEPTYEPQDSPRLAKNYKNATQALLIR